MPQEVDAVESDSPSMTWAVHRQDDNGNRFVVKTGLNEEEAKALVALLEGRRHKQMYWAEPDKDMAMGQ